jgi:hypothetical protein
LQRSNDAPNYLHFLKILSRTHTSLSITVAPITLHPPPGEGLQQLIPDHERTHVPYQVHVEGVLVGEDVVQEVDIPRRQLQRLDLGEFVRRHRRDALPQAGEGLVQTLRPLPLPHVRHHPLVLDVLEALRCFPSRLGLVSSVERVLLVRRDALPFPPEVPRFQHRNLLVRFDLYVGCDEVVLAPRVRVLRRVQLPLVVVHLLGLIEKEMHVGVARRHGLLVVMVVPVRTGSHVLVG